MERSSVIKHLLAVGSGVIVMAWTLYLMVSPSKLVLGFVLLLITFVVVELLLDTRGVQTTEESTIIESGNSLFEVLIVATYIVSLAMIYLISPIYGELWLWWSDLASAHPFNIIRMVAAFGLNFFPGYVILTIAGKRGEFRGLVKLVTSYFLSLFLLTITGLLSAYARGIIDVFFLDVFLLVNATIIFAYFIHRLLRWRRTPVDSGLALHATGKFRLGRSEILVALVVGFVGLWLLWPYSKIDFFIGGPGTDMWRHHGFAQSFLDGRVFAWLQIPWWFDLYLAGFAVISGAPLANAYFSLYPLITISVLSFYVMVSSFFKDKKVAAVATLAYTVFSGPSWLYAVYLRDFIGSSRTWTGLLFDTGGKFYVQGWYPPFVVGLKHSVVAVAALWWMVYAVQRLNLRKGLNFLLMSSIWALSYLFHVIDGLVFFVFLGALLVIYIVSRDTEGKKRIRVAAIAVLIALIFVTVIELCLTNYYFTYTSFYAPSRRYYYLNSPSFYIAAAASVSVIILSYARMPESIYNIFISKYQSLKSKLPGWVNERLGVEVIFYLYGVSLILWFAFFEALDTTQSTVWTLWYAYPVLLGVPFLFSIIGTSILLLRWRKLEKKVKNALIFGVLSSAFLFICGRGITVLNVYFFYTGGGERTILNNYMRPMVGILAAFALFEIFRRIVPRKSFGLKYVTKVSTSTLLISLIVIASVSSTLIAQDFSSNVFFVTKMSEEERQALTYLYYSLPRGYIAYIAKSSGTSYIRAFANDKWWDDPGLWLGGAEWQSGWSGQTPENVLSTMKRTNAAYIYLHRTRDSPELQKSLLLQLLLSVLPVVFNNSEVTIYSVPPSIQAPTSSASELGIVKPSESSGQAFEAYVLSLFTVALSGVSYKILNNMSDPGIESVSNTVLLPYDPVPDEEDASRLFDWVDRGGNLVVFNINSFGIFEDWFGLRRKKILVNCDSDSGWSRWAERGSISIETTEKVEGNASLRLNFENPLSSQWSGWTYNITQTEGKPWNLSAWDTIGIWIHSNSISGPQWYLKLYDINGKTGQFGGAQFLSQWNWTEYVPSFYGWKRILIPAKNYYGELDLTNVTRLVMSTGFQLSVDILVDEITVYQNITGNTYTANSIVGSQTVDLPTITVSSLDIGGTTRVIANYTLNGLPVAPFAIEKDSGSGKVSFISISPVNDFIFSYAGKVDVYDTLDKIYQILQIIPTK